MTTTDDHLPSNLAWELSQVVVPHFGSSRPISIVDLDGTGPPIVFLHGLGCASTMDYASVATDPCLQRRRRILIDLPGSGVNQGLNPPDFKHSLGEHTEIVAELIKALGLARVILFGHSMGGAIALMLAARRPDLVAGLCLTEPALDGGGGTTSTPIAKRDESVFVRFGHAAVVRAAHSGGDPWWRTVERTDALAMHREARSLVAGVEPSWRELLYRTVAPVIYLIGERTLPHVDAVELPRHGIELVIVARAGHGMAWDNPSALAEAICSFLDRHEL
ncbi:MAG: alpha/beta hydrolase [Propionibacteriaceae bacterium]|nr:alpha/beta hydrolase [Propionibacteriaceae bacterium]